LRISVVNTSPEKIWVFPIDVPMGFTSIYMTVNGKRNIRLDMGVDLLWGFPINSNPRRWAHFFCPLERGDSVYKYIFINEPWEYDIPSTSYSIEIEKITHGLQLNLFNRSLKQCPFSPLGGKIEKDFDIKFSIVSPEDIRELELITTIRNPKYPFVPRKSREEKMEAIRKLKEEYPKSPYIPIAMSILEKKKFLENYPNSPFVYEIVKWLAYYSTQSAKGIEGLDEGESLAYFNSFLENNKYKGTLLEDAILLWIDEIGTGKIELWRDPSSVFRRKIK